MMEDNK